MSANTTTLTAPSTTHTAPTQPLISTSNGAAGAGVAVPGSLSSSPSLMRRATPLGRFTLVRDAATTFDPASRLPQSTEAFRNNKAEYRWRLEYRRRSMLAVVR